MKAQTALAIWILIAGGAMAQAQSGIWMGVGPALRSGVVKNEPFSADLVCTNDTTAGTAPGFKTEFHGKVARSSGGSSYFQMEHLLPVSEAPRPVRVTITDPAANTVTTLDPQQKTAFISHVTGPSSAAAGALLTPASTVAVKPSAAPAKTMATPASAAASPYTSSVATKTEDLGSKTLDGVNVVGLRTVRTTTTGVAEGKSFVSTTDTWTSPELKVVVMMETTTSNGDRHLTKLANIVRTEPSAALFQVPAGYSVRENAPLASNVR